MKAIAINGSPRPGGNTEIMLKKGARTPGSRGLEHRVPADRRKTRAGLHGLLQVLREEERAVRRREGPYERLPGTDLRG